ncbi:hypothetical protein ACFL1Q_00030 [Patescibacteria group bacterium]
MSPFSVERKLPDRSQLEGVIEEFEDGTTEAYELGEDNHGQEIIVCIGIYEKNEIGYNIAGKAWVYINELPVNEEESGSGTIRFDENLKVTNPNTRDSIEVTYSKSKERD